MQEGIVIKSTGSWYQVRLPDDSVLRCRIKGKFRLAGKQLTNPVAVGDRVRIISEIENTDGINGVIKEIMPRRNYVARQSPRQHHQIHLMVSNIDQAFLFVTVVQPMLKQGFIDRFLLMTEPHDIPTFLVFNKADVYEDKDRERFEYLKNIYEKIGYKVLLVSAIRGDGLDELKELLKDKTSLLSGQSGVGKSTTVNALQPRLDLRTEELSDYSGKGQHTTTFAEMHPLDFGGFIVDTPGIKLLAFNNLEPKDVAHNFREFFQFAPNCRFSNCAHRNEPLCAVKSAIESGDISELRYNNYLQILEEIEDINYWERHSDM